MNLYFRFLFLFIKRIFTPKRLQAFDTCVTTFWANPMDIDLNFHMNNGRYLSIMDLGRMDLLIRTGLIRSIFSQGYYPVVASQAIRFRKDIKAFQFFKIHTSIDSWDEKYFYMSQKFFIKDKLIAEGYIKACFKKRGKRGTVSTQKSFELMNTDYTGPNISNKSDQLNNITHELARTPDPEFKNYL